MPRRSACGDDNTLRIFQRRQHILQSAELCISHFKQDPPTHRVAESLRLFHDFLEHEMLKAPLFDLSDIDRHLMNLFLNVYVIDRFGFE